jgi:hypothetical protein
MHAREKSHSSMVGKSPGFLRWGADVKSVTPDHGIGEAASLFMPMMFHQRSPDFKNLTNKSIDFCRYTLQFVANRYIWFKPLMK